MLTPNMRSEQALFSLYLTLTRFRLHGYARATGRALRRHWQWLLVAGLLVPGGAPVRAVLRALAYPLRALLIPGHGLIWHLGYILILQVAASTWVMPLRRHIEGDRFMQYAATLPLTPAIRRSVDLTLLILANSVLLVPAGVALGASAARIGMGGLYSVVALGVLLGVSLVVQWAVLQRRWIILSGVVLADLALGLSLTLEGAIGSWLTLALACASAPAALALRRPRPAVPDRRQLLPRDRPGCGTLPWRWFPADLRLQGKALAAQQPAAAVVRIGLVLGLALATDRLMQIFRFDVRSLPVAILAMAAIALVLAGIYRTLQLAHTAMRFYLATLPLGKRYWPVRDILFVTLLGLVPLGVLLAPLMIHRLAPLPTLALLALADLALLALLRLPSAWGGRQAVLLGVLLAGAWSGAAIAAVTR